MLVGEALLADVRAAAGEPAVTAEARAWMRRAVEALEGGRDDAARVLLVVVRREVVLRGGDEGLEEEPRLARDGAELAAVVERCAAAFAALGEVEVMAALRGEAALERGDVVQPAQFAVCLGLVAVWQALAGDPSGPVAQVVGEFGVGGELEGPGGWVGGGEFAVTGDAIKVGAHEDQWDLDGEGGEGLQLLAEGVGEVREVGGEEVREADDEQDGVERLARAHELEGELGGGARVLEQELAGRVEEVNLMVGRAEAVASAGAGEEGGLAVAGEADAQPLLGGARAAGGAEGRREVEMLAEAGLRRGRVALAETAGEGDEDEDEGEGGGVGGDGRGERDDAVPRDMWCEGPGEGEDGEQPRCEGADAVHDGGSGACAVDRGSCLRAGVVRRRSDRTALAV